jgi:RNA polymerase-binding transcription factor
MHIRCPSWPVQSWKREQSAKANRSCHSSRHLLARICIQSVGKASPSAIRHDVSLQPPKQPDCGIMAWFWSGQNASKNFGSDQSGQATTEARSRYCCEPRNFSSFKETLEARIFECERVLANAEQETRANSARHADSVDQAAAEYERQTLAHKADVARQTIRRLSDALKRISQGSFGECAHCGGEIEIKRLDAIPWARFCVKCQEAREQQ